MSELHPNISRYGKYIKSTKNEPIQTKINDVNNKLRRVAKSQ